MQISINQECGCLHYGKNNNKEERKRIMLEKKDFDAEGRIKEIIKESEGYIKEFNDLVSGITNAQERQKVLMDLINQNNGKIQGIREIYGEPKKKDKVVKSK